MSNMTEIVRQAQKMQGRISKIQEDFKERKIEAAAGGGVVVAVVNGDQELLELKINPEVVDPQDIETLQELVVAAVNQAMKSAGEMLNSEIEKVTGGFNLPGMF